MKLAVFFPGIGYHTDKPLLYYSQKLAKQYGYEILPLSYSGFPADVKSSPEKMEQAFFSALSQTEEQLRAVDFSSYSRLLFVSKSVGTAVAAAYSRKYKLSPGNVFYTPVAASFGYMGTEGVVFTGTKDPWVETSVVEQGCSERRLPLTVIPEANHSLETGDALADIGHMKEIMERTRQYIVSLEQEATS